MTVFVMGLYLLGIIIFVYLYKYKKDYLKKIDGLKAQPKVSIVIPAKDEEKNIGKTIESVIVQDYPEELFEVIVVNDRSTDKTREIVEGYMKKHKNLRIVNITEKSETLAGKQNGLDKGIKAAAGEVIMVTDADCVINKNWVSSLARHFEVKEVGIVVGKTEILISENKFIEKFQAMAHRFLLDVAHIPIIFGRYTSGMGNNLAFRKQAYLDVGGYEGLGKSILDDEILIRGIAQKGYSVAGAFGKNDIVYTHPMEDWKKLILQHKRWVVGSLNFKTPSGFLVFTLYALNLLTLVLIGAAIYGTAVHGFSAIDILKNGAILKVLADIILFMNLNRSEERKPLNFIDELIIGTMTTAYLVLIATLAFINPKVKWKNDKLKTTSN